MTTATAGTGTITLGSAIASGAAINLCGFHTFAAAGVTNSTVVSYLILDANGAWEYGTGTYTTSGTTLSRTLGASSTGSLLSLSGSAQVFITARAEDIVNTTTQVIAGTGMSGGGALSGNVTLTNAGVVTVKVQTFAASGTYTPSAGMLYAIMEGVGCGGGGGGVANDVSGADSAGGGGSGSYSKVTVSAATVGASKAVTIGSVGTSGANTGGNGGAGGDVSVGTLLVAKGGSGGTGGTNGAGGAGGVAGTGDLTIVGNAGSAGSNAGSSGTNNGMFRSGCAPSFWGGGAMPSSSEASAAGRNGGNYGAGGEGGLSWVNGGAAAGGTGGAGFVLITEYCSQ